MDVPPRDSREPPRRRLVLLVESPLSERDANRFGIHLLMNLGFNVEVWDVATLTLPHSELQAIQPPENVTIRQIKSLDELKRLSDGLLGNDLVIFLLGVYRGQLDRCRTVGQTLSSSKARLGAVLGISPWSRTHLTTAYAEEWPAQKFAYLKFRYFLAMRFHKGMQASLNLPGIRAMRRYRSGIRALDLLWVATSRKPIDPLFIGPKTVTRFVHTFDFDLVRSVTTNASQVHPHTIAYIDGLGPIHPDITTLGIALPLPSIDSYFSKIRFTLDWIESATGLPVVVAAHPRATPGSLEPLYGNRTVRYGATAEVIRDCRLAVLGHPSDSVSLIVALHRPALFVYSEGQFRYERALRRDLVKILKLKSLCVENFPKDFEIPIPNEKAYGDFFEKHVKKPGTPDNTFWEVVAADALSTQVP